MASATTQALASFPAGGVAVIIGSTGGIGAALTRAAAASGRFDAVVGLSRRSTPPIELTDEVLIAQAANHVASLGGDLRLVFDATGVLKDGATEPERTWRQLDAASLAHAFAVNAIGPALLMKHFLPLLGRQGKSVFATLSAKVGSIGDNQLGGWYGYRASKAALNQLVRTAAVELARQRPEAICLSLHPGTVDTGLSAPFARTGLDVRTPDAAAALLIQVLDTATPAWTGGFFDYGGAALPW